MKNLVFYTILATAFCASANTNAVLFTQYEDGTINAWTQADLKDALGLMNRKYHRDMKTESGRRAWHGEKLNQYLLTNDTTKLIYAVTLYADGYAHTALSKPVRPKDPEAALKAKLEAMSGKTVTLTFRVDAEIMGGVIVEFDGKVMDGSVRHRLRELTDAISI